jgi:hypothetical protein
VQGLLQLRERLTGASGAPLSPKRFLFEAVGEASRVAWLDPRCACLGGRARQP